jgi:hypothetical protein
MKLAYKIPVAAFLVAISIAVQTVAPAQPAAFKVPTEPFVEDPYTLYLLHFNDDKETVQGKPFTPFHGEAKWVPGKFGKAFEFDGSQLLLVPAYGSQEVKPGKVFQTTGTDESDQEGYGNSLGLNLKNGQFTMECWIKISPDTFTGKREQTIVAFGATCGLKVSPKGTISFYVPIDWKGHSYRLTGSKKIVDGNWHHVAGVVENKDATMHQLRLYIDGQRDEGEDKVDNMQGVGFTVTAQNMPLPDNFFTVGGWRPHDETFTGTLDELRVSFKARYPS